MVVKDIPRSIGPLPPDTETVNSEAEYLHTKIKAASLWLRAKPLTGTNFKPGNLNWGSFAA